MLSGPIPSWNGRGDGTAQKREEQHMEMISDISRRKKLIYQINRKTIQFLTSHSLFQRHRCILCKSDNDTCLNCNKDSQIAHDPKHRLTTCTNFYDIHDNIIQLILDYDFNTWALKNQKTTLETIPRW